MKTIYAIAAAIAVTASPAIAKPGCNAACLIKKLPNTTVKQAISEVNNEDQRVVDGSFNASTGVLTLYTQDMVAGADGDISRRAVTIKDFEAMQGAPGKDGRDGKGRDGADGAPGKDGKDGKDGLDGKNADTAAINAQLGRIRGQASADRAVGSLQTRTPIAGQWTGSMGLSGTGGSVDGVAGGARYGFSDRSDIYVVVGRSFGGETSWGLGATFILGGN